MSKYIVKNCPAMTDQGNCFQGSLLLGTAYQDCCERNDCLIKQVIEKCREECDPTNDDWCRVKENLSREFLQLFEIEECE